MKGKHLIGIGLGLGVVSLFISGLLGTLVAVGSGACVGVGIFKITHGG